MIWGAVRGALAGAAGTALNAATHLDMALRVAVTCSVPHLGEQ